MSLEEIALHLAHGLRDLGQVLYMGPMLAFTLLLAGSRLVTTTRLEDVVRVYRTWGPGLGLSLGAWVLGLLVTRWLETGGFTWPLGTLPEQLDTAGWVAFFFLWANNCRLEVWTLDPLRKLDKAGEGIADPAAYRAAAGRLVRVMALQSTLLLLAWGLWGAARALS